MGYAAAETDSHGRYRILRDEDEPSIVIYSDQYHTDRYLTVVRRLTDAKGFGEIVADFDIPRGVVINGRVLEAGTDRPIVSAPRQGCHDTVPGPLLAGNVCYFPLSTNTALRGAPTGLYFEGFQTGARITTGLSRSAETGGSALPSRQDRESLSSRHLPVCPCSPKCGSGRKAKDSTACSPT